MSRLTLGAVMATLLAALLACGGGSKDDCKAEITRDGKMASGKGEDRLTARHSACRAWCKANDPKSSDDDLLAVCASRCGGDLMFGQATGQASCK